MGNHCIIMFYHIIIRLILNIFLKTLHVLQKSHQIWFCTRLNRGNAPTTSEWSTISLPTTGLNNSIGPIAQNCPKWPSGNHICGPKLPAKLLFWKFGQQTFSCVKQLLTAHPMRSWFWEVFWKVTHLVLNQLLLIVSMISSSLYLV